MEDNPSIDESLKEYQSVILHAKLTAHMDIPYPSTGCHQTYSCRYLMILCSYHGELCLISLQYQRYLLLLDYNYPGYSTDYNIRT